MAALTRRQRIKLLLVAGALALVLYPVVDEEYILLKRVGAYFPLFEFTAACKIQGSFYRRVTYPYTAEFWDLVRKEFQEDDHRTLPYGPTFIRDWVAGAKYRAEKVYVTLSWLIQRSEEWQKWDSPTWEVKAYYYSVDPVRLLYQRRLSEGALSPKDLADLHTFSDPTRCGFMEQLIVKGGYFTPAEIAKRNGEGSSTDIPQ